MTLQRILGLGQDICIASNDDVMAISSLKRSLKVQKC
jgi:hypothetical protein